MKSLVSACLLIVFFSNRANPQISCYKVKLEAAIKSYGEKKYSEAIEKFKIAAGCPDANKTEAQAWISKARAKQVPLKKDTDGDGTPDKNDSCPYDWGPKSNNGCPDDQETAPQLPEKEDTYVLEQTDTFLIRNRWTGEFFYNESVSETLKPGLKYYFENLRNASWIFGLYYSKKSGYYYTIKNLATGHSLVFDNCASHADKDQVFLFRTDNPDPGDGFYRVNFELADSANGKKFYKITGRCGSYLHLEHRQNRVECGDIEPGWWSSMWEVYTYGGYMASVYEDLPSCTLYNRNYVSAFRNSNTIKSGTLKIIADYGGCYKINLFHSDMPDRVQKVIEVCNENGKLDFHGFDFKNYPVSNAWGIQIVFENGVKSCIRTVESVSSFTNNELVIKTTGIFNGTK